MKATKNASVIYSTQQAVDIVEKQDKIEDREEMKERGFDEIIQGFVTKIFLLS